MALPFDIDPTAVVIPDVDIAVVAPGAPPPADAWAVNPVPVVAKGLGTEAIWFRVSLHNPDPVARRVWLELGNPSIDRVAVAADGRSVGEAGLLVPRDRWPASTPAPTFPNRTSVRTRPSRSSA